MKFRCPKCKARYNIPDEKVRNKVLKIRCKRCRKVMVVRDGGTEGRASTPPPRSQPPAPAPALGAPEQLPEAQWFVGIQGQQQGPYTARELMDRLTDGRVGLDALVWCDGMGDWLQVASLPALMAWAQWGQTRRGQRAPTPPPPPRGLSPRPSSTGADAARSSPLPRSTAEEDQRSATQDAVRDALTALEDQEQTEPVPDRRTPALASLERAGRAAERAPTPAILIQPPEGGAKVFPDLGDMATVAAMEIPRGPEPSGEAVMTSAPADAVSSFDQDLSMGAMVADEIGRPAQTGPFFPPPAEGPRSNTGEFSVIVRLQKANRRYLWYTLLGVPAAIAALVAIVFFTQRDTLFPPEELATLDPETETGGALARPVYEEEETKLRTEDAFTMEFAPEEQEELRKPVHKRRASRKRAAAAPSTGRSSTRPAAIATAPPPPPESKAGVFARLARMERGRSALDLTRPERQGRPLTPPAQVTSEITKAVKARLPRVRRCLDRELKRSGAVSNTKVQIEFLVRASGTASKVKLTPSVGDGYFQRCVSNVIQRTPFPRFNGDPRPVIFPLVLTQSGS